MNSFSRFFSSCFATDDTVFHNVLLDHISTNQFSACSYREMNRVRNIVCISVDCVNVHTDFVAELDTSYCVMMT